MLSYNNIHNFDTTMIDQQIEDYVDNQFEQTFTPDINKSRIAVLASQFYDFGGHSECVRRLVSNLSDKYEIKVFLTRKIQSYAAAPNKMQLIGEHAQIDGFDCISLPCETGINLMFRIIKEFSPKMLFVFIHPDDMHGASLMALIQKYTNIKIVFVNHASHYPALGFSFADLILVFLQSIYYIDKIYRKCDKHHIIEAFSDKIEDIKYFSDREIEIKRQELGIGKNDYCTMSGADRYKFFDGQKSSYFEMIKRLLEKEVKLKHVVISNFQDSELQIIDKIINEPSLRNRLILIPTTSNYQILFQSCDVFIDSLPVSSALTQIDLMKFKRPTVVKINTENKLHSFHEYMPENYPYMFDNISDMENGILRLLYSKEEQQKIIEMNYNHYLESFEGNKVKQKYINLIENCDNIEQFYIKADKNTEANFKVFHESTMQKALFGKKINEKNR